MAARSVLDYSDGRRTKLPPSFSDFDVEGSEDEQTYQLVRVGHDTRAVRGLRDLAAPAIWWKPSRTTELPSSCMIIGRVWRRPTSTQNAVGVHWKMTAD